MKNEDRSPAAFLPYARFWRRAASYLVDCLILVPVISLYVVVVATAPSVRVAVSAVISLWASWLAYIIYFHSQWGQTVGKMSLGIKVVQMSGAPITLPHAIRRSSVDIALWLAGAAGLLYAVIDWHEPRWSTIVWHERFSVIFGRAAFTYWLWGEVASAWYWCEVGVLLLNKKRRAIHDFIAGTVVIRAPR